MCGIAGILEQKPAGGPGSLRAMARKMTDRLIHRGPDGGDIWTDGDTGIALGHRRLAALRRTRARNRESASTGKN